MIGQKKKIVELNGNKGSNTAGHGYRILNDDKEAEGGDNDGDSDSDSDSDGDSNNYNYII